MLVVGAPEASGDAGMGKVGSPHGGIDFDDESRTPENWNFVVMCVHLVFKMSVLTLIITSTDDYTSIAGLNGAFWPGFVIGVLPLCGGFASFFWEKVNSSYGYKKTSLYMCFTGTAGGVMYAFAGYAHSPVLLLGGRIVMGISSSSNLVFHFISIAVGKKKKLVYSGSVSSSVYFGFALGPLIAGAIFGIFGNWDPTKKVSPIFNVLTAPGWVAAVGYGVLALVYVAFFEDVPITEFARFKMFSKVDLESIGTSKETPAWTMMCLFLILVFGSTGTSGIEARSAFVASAPRTPPDSSGYGWGWGQAYASLYVSGILFFLAILCVLSVKFRSGKKVAENYWLITFHGIVPAVSSILFFNFDVSFNVSVILWSLGSIAFACGLAIAKGFLFSVTMKLAPRKQMGFWMSALGLANSIGRCAGPALATSIGHGYLHQNVFASVFLVIFTVACFVLFSLYKKLRV